VFSLSLLSWNQLFSEYYIINMGFLTPSSFPSTNPSRKTKQKKKNKDARAKAW